MKLPQAKSIKWNYLALAFAIPSVAILTVMLICQFEPFGQYAILYSDMYHQYYPFFVAFRKALLSGESLLWSWSVGMGMDYLGLIAYYLGSPLNLLSVLMPESILLECFSLLLPIRLGLAGMFFGIFLQKIFNICGGVKAAVGGIQKGAEIVDTFHGYSSCVYICLYCT